MHSAGLVQRLAVDRGLTHWVDSVAHLTRPAIVHWCTGTAAERAKLQQLMLREGTLRPLDSKRHPRSFLTHLQPTRTESARRLLCSRSEAQAGPSNCWADPAYMQDVLAEMFAGCMQGRVMYVVPYLLGPSGSPLCHAGVQITDSPFVATVSSLMTRVGQPALSHIRATGRFTQGLHSVGQLDAEQRIVCHFPDDELIASYGSNQLEDSVFAASSQALRLVGSRSRREGWLAEHLSVCSITSPDGAKSFIGIAGPAGSGKTTLAMLTPPDADLLAGWRLETVSDDIAWLHVGADGQLHATNPHTGLLARVVGTTALTHANLFQSMGENAIFTNAAISTEQEIWWDDRHDAPPDFCTDWSGRQWVPSGSRPAAHSDARCILPFSQCPNVSSDWNNPAGVPLSAILFCGRRRSTIPLVFESKSWQHGVYLGATLMSEAADRTASAAPSFDPMGQLSECGYHLADHWQNWLNQGRRARVELPRIYQVNWFRQDGDGHNLWPGFRDNFRVLKWIVERSRGRGESRQTPLGAVPTAQALGLVGESWTPELTRALLEVNSEEWYKELDQREEFLVRFSTKLPPELLDENETLRRRIRYARTRTEPEPQ